MTVPEAFKVLPPGDGRTVTVAGGHYTIKASGEDTGGAYALIEMLLPPLAGPLPHIHAREEEAFYIVEGTVLFQVGDDSLRAEAGTFVKAPSGIRHTFKNVGANPDKVLLLVAPAGLEKFFLEVGQPTSQASAAVAPPDLDKLREVAPNYGLTLLNDE